MNQNKSKENKIENKMNEWLKILVALFLSLSLILLAQFVKYVKTMNSEKPSLPITGKRFLGLFGFGDNHGNGSINTQSLTKTTHKNTKVFRVLGWVSISSLIFCLCFLLHWGYTCGGFLGITTTVLTFAGFSIGDRLGDLKRISWKIVIVGSCVFIGTYLGSALIAHWTIIMGKIKIYYI